MKEIIYQLRVFWHHIKCGWHSGISVCCILFYMTLWQLFIIIQKSFSFHVKDFYSDQFKGFGFGYVPCPLCLLLGYRVKGLKSCNCEYPYREDYAKIKK